MKLLEEFNGERLPKLETDRLVLRQCTLEDASDIFLYSSLEEASYNAGFRTSQSIEDTYEYLNHFHLNFYEAKKIPVGYGITLKGEDKVIGTITFNTRHSDDVFEIGYILNPEYWGRGIVPEAGHAMLEVGFAILNLHKIELRCYDYNQRSIRVAEKLGFKLEGTVRDRLDVRGNRCNECIYGLLKSEWLENERN
ncbi:MAG: GNAT family protein [Streptococcus sp.]|nr:GNAT family protein [Streptococcus sp.]